MASPSANELVFGCVVLILLLPEEGLGGGGIGISSVVESVGDVHLLCIGLGVLILLCVGVESEGMPQLELVLVVLVSLGDCLQLEDFQFVTAL